MTQDGGAQSIQESGFHPRTSELTDDFRDHKGFRLAGTYRNGGALEEYWACRRRAAVADRSALRKFEVLGPDAEALVAYTLTRDVRRLAIGQVAYSALCDETGGMIDDGTLFRLGPDNFRWVGNDDRGGAWLRAQAEAQGFRVWIKPASDRLHNVAVQGPKSLDVLADTIWTPPAQPSVAELAHFRFAVGRLGAFDGRPLVVSRTGFTSGLGYEVWCHPKDAVEVWDAIARGGEPHGLAPLGLDALEILRIEAGRIAAGAEFSEGSDPFEVGIGFAVDLDTKNEAFLGREALADRKENQENALAGLVLDAAAGASGTAPAALAAPGDGIWSGAERVGTITSAAASPALEKTVALSRISRAHATPGGTLEVGPTDDPDRRQGARVATLPFTDPNSEGAEGSA